MFDRIKIYLIFSIAALLFPLSVSIAKADLNQQRQYFLDAEKAFHEGNQEKFSALRTKLTNYPLYPYLVYLDLEKNIHLDREEEILSFINEYKSCPLSGRLRQMWLKYLGGKHQWPQLVRDYREPASQRVQ